MSKDSNNSKPARIGIHYYPDTKHYRASDSAQWIPELKSLGVSWIALTAPQNRAIPEPFLKDLIANQIEPIIHFQYEVGQHIDLENLRLFLSMYKRWGVKYVILFDKPNTRSCWRNIDWAQRDLVERFLDIYIPLISKVEEAGLIPVFPPLEPGGDYWDTVFLKAALNGMQRRGCKKLLSKLHLSAYPTIFGKPLSWGAGGPERWPRTQPYSTPRGQEDQRGFHIFDWYLAIADSVLGKRSPIILLGSGIIGAFDYSMSVEEHAQRVMNIIDLLHAKPSQKPRAANQVLSDPVPTEVICCNFWLLAANPQSNDENWAWYGDDGDTLPIVGNLRNWVAANQIKSSSIASNKVANPLPLSGQPIPHYLLLPRYEWGIAEWHLEVIRPFVIKYQPTIGFSLDEASHARLVTVIGGQGSFPDDELDRLRSSGCEVERISGDGTSIATTLASL
ncbi:MAG: hypothetical protein KAT29_09405 [Anaerolineales bacterium]|nr:hypothetical protein [Anaerolineales bacterium]